MAVSASERLGSRGSSLAVYAFGGLVGGLIGSVVVIGFTLTLKAGLAIVSRQPAWVMIAAPLVGLALTTLVLWRLGRGATDEASMRQHPWRTFPRGAVRHDLAHDFIDTAGEEERFPWRLAPLRALAIFCTVGLGGPLGTETPAAFLGTAAGAFLGDRNPKWYRYLRPLALGGGAAGVAALMGIPLVGTGYMLEHGRRHGAPLSPERLIAATIGGFVGWAIDVVFGISLITLVVPHQAPRSLDEAALTALCIGLLAGAITGVAGAAMHWAKKWKASPALKVVAGGLVVLLAMVLLHRVAEPSAAIGPGAGAIRWAEKDVFLPRTLLAVALLRALATIAAMAAGGCGGVFVPYLTIGDLAGRVFAPGLDLGHDLAGAAGAAAGLAAGYRLPFTALSMVLWLGGPPLAKLTCLAAVMLASLVGVGIGKLARRPAH